MAPLYLWFGVFMAGVIPGVALAHAHRAVLGWTINVVVLLILAVIRWRYRQRKRRQVDF
jgi:membrane protein DedA with SNARE-associated domain